MFKIVKNNRNKLKIIYVYNGKKMNKLNKKNFRKRFRKKYWKI